MERITGTIKKLVEAGGYGFISSPEKKFTRIYFHFSALPVEVNFLDLHVGMEISFECSTYVDKDGVNRGWRALNIQLEDVKNGQGIPEAKVERIT